MSVPALTPSIHWQVAPTPPQAVLEAVLDTQPIHPAVARIAARRIPSVDEVSAWFNALREPFCNPLELHGVATAAQRIREAIERKEPITIFGDYDTDGITATTLMVQALTQCGANVKPFIPDRETEGYGLTPKAIERCLAQLPFPRLLITVDCGISSVAEVADLNARGIEVIVTDHHVVPEVLPPALAVVNPRIQAPKGAEGMCGCATAFTLMRKVLEDFEGLDARAFLDLVAVATIADVMTLSGENRSLVTKGLWILADPERGNPGLAALAKAQKLDLRHQRPKMPNGLSLPPLPPVDTIAFGLVPCINAASRIGRCALAYDLLNVKASGMECKRCEAETIDCSCAALALVEANKERRLIEQRLREVVEAQQLQPRGNLVIAAGTREEGFESGVLGIVAARLSDAYHLPAVVCCIKPDGSASGSMRSKGSWHAVEALDTIADLCEHYGGHAAAAGFALKPGAFEAFCERLPQAFAEGGNEADVKIYEEDLAEAIDELFCKDLEKLEPFGAGNPRPCFAKHFILKEAKVIGADKTHLRLSLGSVSTSDRRTYEAFWFGAAHRAASWTSGMRLRLFFTVARDKLRMGEWKLYIEDAIPVP